MPAVTRLGGFAAIGFAGCGLAAAVLRTCAIRPDPPWSESARRAPYRRTARRAVRGGLPCGRPGAQHFSYPHDAGGWIMDAEARWRSVAQCSPAGVRQHRATDRRDARPEARWPTPARASFLRILLEKAGRELGTPITSLKRHPCRANTSRRNCAMLLKARGIVGTQTYATADLGLIAYEGAGCQR